VPATAGCRDPVGAPFPLRGRSVGGFEPAPENARVDPRVPRRATGPPKIGRREPQRSGDSTPSDHAAGSYRENSGPRIDRKTLIAHPARITRSGRVTPRLFPTGPSPTRPSPSSARLTTESRTSPRHEDPTRRAPRVGGPEQRQFHSKPPGRRHDHRRSGTRGALVVSGGVQAGRRLRDPETRRARAGRTPRFANSHSQSVRPRPRPSRQALAEAFRPESDRRLKAYVPASGHRSARLPRRLRLGRLDDSRRPAAAPRPKSGTPRGGLVRALKRDQLATGPTRPLGGGGRRRRDRRRASFPPAPQTAPPAPAAIARGTGVDALSLPVAAAATPRPACRRRASRARGAHTAPPAQPPLPARDHPARAASGSRLVSRTRTGRRTLLGRSPGA